MSQVHKASRLLLKNQFVPVDFTTAHFNYNQDTLGLQYGDIIEPSGNNISTMVNHSGNFGVAIEESTTNFALNPSFATLSSWFLSKSPTSTATLTTDGSWAKINVPSGESGFYYFVYQDITRATAANKQMTFSMLFKNDIVGKFALRLVLFASNVAVSQPTAEVSLDGTGIPKRVFVTASHTAATERIRIDVLAGSNYTIHGGLSNLSVEFSDAQIEEKPFSTSFIAGSRGVGRLAYPSLLSGNTGTVSFWATFEENYVQRPTSYWARIIDQYGTNNKGVVLFCTPGASAKMYLYITPVSGSNASVNTSFLPMKGETYFIAFNYKSGEQNVYVGTASSSPGFIKAGSSSANLGSDLGGNIFMVGSNGANDASNTIIRDLAIDNTFISEEEIYARYISSYPLYNPYDYRSYTF